LSGARFRESRHAEFPEHVFAINWEFDYSLRDGQADLKDASSNGTQLTIDLTGEFGKVG
jgi:hypothetical protein